MNKKIVGGCCGLIALAIVAVIVVVSVSAPRIVQKGKKWITAQTDDATRRSAVESAWQPPGAKPDASWFPAAVDQWTLSISEDISTVPDLQFDRPGRRGKYRGEKQDIEVIVVPASDAELDGIFKRAVSSFAEGGNPVIEMNSQHFSYKTESNGSPVASRSVGRLYARLNGDNHLRLWWLKDWLFIFRTTGSEDPDAFAEKYLEAMTPRELEKR